MQNTPLYQAMIKNGAAPATTAHALAILYTWPKGRWFKPTNEYNNAFDVCQLLHEYHLIEKATQPLYKGSSFVGTAIYFRYNKDLKYKAIK